MCERFAPPHSPSHPACFERPALATCRRRSPPSTTALAHRLATYRRPLPSPLCPRPLRRPLPLPPPSTTVLAPHPRFRRCSPAQLLCRPAVGASKVANVER